MPIDGAEGTGEAYGPAEALNVRIYTAPETQTNRAEMWRTIRAARIAGYRVGVMRPCEMHEVARFDFVDPCDCREALRGALEAIAQSSDNRLLTDDRRRDACEVLTRLDSQQ